MFWTIIVWAGLTIIFLYRLRVILWNCQYIIRSQKRFFQIFPSLDPRPIKQLFVWLIEMGALWLFYIIFGVTVLAHLTASIVGAFIMLMLRDRGEKNPLRAINLLPMLPAAQRRGA